MKRIVKLLYSSLNLGCSIHSCMKLVEPGVWFVCSRASSVVDGNAKRKDEVWV